MTDLDYRRDYDDDDSYKKTTVRRYKVAGDRVERVDDDSRSHVSRRSYVPERPRSAFAERREYYDDVRRDEFDDIRRGEWDDDDAYVVRRHRRPSDDIVVETVHKDRHNDAYGTAVEHYRKETEYYQAPERVREPPLVIRPKEKERELVVREKKEDRLVRKRDDRDRDDRDDRDRDDDRNRDQDRHRHHHHHHHRSDSASSGSVVVTRTVIRRERSRSSSASRRRHLAEGALAGAGLGALLGSRRNDSGELPAHRGRKVLAGAALGALGTEVLRRAHSAYEGHHDPEFDDDDRSARDRSPHHHSKLKTGLGLAAAAIAVAGAAKYMQSSRVDKEERRRGRSLRRDEDYGYHSDYSGRDGGGGGRSASAHSGRSHKSNHSLAKAAVGTAAVAGLVHHLRSKSRGKSQDGRRRKSHSRLRTGAEIAAAGLAGAAAKKLYDKHKEKKEVKERGLVRSGGGGDHDRAISDDGYDDGYDDYSRDDDYDDGDSQSYDSEYDDRHRRRRHHPHRARSVDAYADGGADRELGLVEYGAQPLYGEADAAQPPYPGDAGARGSYPVAGDGTYGDRPRDYDSAADARDVRDVDDQAAKRSRSRSRLRNAAAAGVGAAAAAIGLKAYDRRNKSRDRDADRDTRDDRHRDHNRDYRDTRDRDAPHDDDYDDYYSDRNSRPPSPPHASGGAYYPPAGGVPAGVVPTGGVPAADAPVMQHPNTAYTPAANEPYTPYRHPDLPPGPPVGDAAAVPPPPAAQQQQQPPPRPVGDSQPGPTRPRDADDPTVEDEALIPAKSVGFAPLSPQSSRTLRRMHEELVVRNRGDNDDDDTVDEVLPDRFDGQGRPIDDSDTPSGRKAAAAARRGDFAYDRNGWHARGQWAVAGTDTAAVERMAAGVREVLDGVGRGGLLGVLGGVAGLLADGVAEEPTRPGPGPGPGRRRSMDDHAYRRTKKRRTASAEGW